MVLARNDRAGCVSRRHPAMQGAACCFQNPDDLLVSHPFERLDKFRDAGSILQILEQGINGDAGPSKQTAPPIRSESYHVYRSADIGKFYASQRLQED